MSRGVPVDRSAKRPPFRHLATVAISPRRGCEVIACRRDLLQLRTIRNSKASEHLQIDYPLKMENFCKGGDDDLPTARIRGHPPSACSPPAQVWLPTCPRGVERSKSLATGRGPKRVCTTAGAARLL